MYSRSNPSDQVLKRWAGRKHQPRPERKPYLCNLGWLCVPARRDWPNAGEVLEALGFEYSGLGDEWVRNPYKPHPVTGKVYPAADWLDWARRRVAALKGQEK